MSAPGIHAPGREHGAGALTSRLLISKTGPAPTPCSLPNFTVAAEPHALTST